MYGGTQAEMARLINDSGVLGDAIEVTAKTVNEVPFDKVIEAIHVIQTELGITGTTAKEAASTIQGSISSMKAAFNNLMVSVSGGGKSVEKAVDDLSESLDAVLDNLLPRIDTALLGISKAVDVALPRIFERIPKMISDYLPTLANSAVKMLQSLIRGLTSNPDALAAALSSTLLTVISGISEVLPEFVEGGMRLVAALVKGIAGDAKNILTAFVDGVLGAVMALTEPDVIVELVTAAAELVEALCEGLIENAPKIVAAVPVIIMNLQEGIIASAPQLALAAGKLIFNLVNPFYYIENAKTFIKAGVDSGERILDGFAENIKNAWKLGQRLIDGIMQGVTEFAKDPGEWFSGIFDKLWEEAKRVGSQIAEYFIDLFSFGWLKDRADTNDMPQGSSDAPGGAGDFVNSTRDFPNVNPITGGIDNIYININGVDYPDEEKLAEAISRRIQEAADDRSVAFL